MSAFNTVSQTQLSVVEACGLDICLPLVYWPYCYAVTILQHDTSCFTPVIAKVWVQCKRQASASTNDSIYTSLSCRHEGGIAESHN